MEIIDSHIHCFKEDSAQNLAQKAGHENSIEHLRGEYARLGIIGAVVMGNRTLALEDHVYPEFMRYCIGLDSYTEWKSDIKNTYDFIERHLQRETCVGVKLYPGYNHLYISDEIYTPVYELTQRYEKSVAVHTGDTLFPIAKLKYCHPLTLDEVAASFPKVQFVMCHLGNPWLVDAAAVISKNPNVAADLSGLFVGVLDVPAFFCERAGYIKHISTWLAYMGDYDRLMFGTDWPIANIQNYIDFTSRLIPEKHHEKVFSDNAGRIYGLNFPKNQPRAQMLAAPST